jgi:predicted dehydrogenase
MDALRAGKHVFCEKPITVNYELSKEMADEANKRGLMLNIGVCNRYVKSVEHLAELNREGKFGKIYHVYASFRGFRSTPGLGGPFTTKSQSGGGVLIDWGVHFFDLIMYILGEDTELINLTADAYGEVSRDMKNYKHNVPMWAEDTSDIENGTMDVEDYISGYIRTNNASISFNGAWAQNVFKDEMYIDFMGDKGGIRLQYGKGFTYYTAKDGQLIEETPEIETANLFAEMFQNEINSFVRCIKSGEKLPSHIDNVIKSARIMQAMYDSSDKKQEIKL